MIAGKTTTGFKFKITDDRLDNYELMEVLGEVEANPLVFTKLIKLLLGEEQAKAFKEHHRNPDGIIPTSIMSEAIGEILATKPVKN